MIQTAGDKTRNDLAVGFDGPEIRGVLVERAMRPVGIIQRDDGTPTGPRNARFFIGGTLGRGLSSKFMR